MEAVPETASPPQPEASPEIAQLRQVIQELSQQNRHLTQAVNSLNRRLDQLTPQKTSQQPISEANTHTDTHQENKAQLEQYLARVQEQRNTERQRVRYFQTGSNLDAQISNYVLEESNLDSETVGQMTPSELTNAAQHLSRGETLANIKTPLEIRIQQAELTLHQSQELDQLSGAAREAKFNKIIQKQESTTPTQEKQISTRNMTTRQRIKFYAERNREHKDKPEAPSTNTDTIQTETPPETQDKPEQPSSSEQEFTNDHLDSLLNKIEDPEQRNNLRERIQNTLESDENFTLDQLRNENGQLPIMGRQLIENAENVLPPQEEPELEPRQHAHSSKKKKLAVAAAVLATAGLADPNTSIDLSPLIQMVQTTDFNSIKRSIESLTSHPRATELIAHAQKHLQAAKKTGIDTSVISDLANNIEIEELIQHLNSIQQ